MGTGISEGTSPADADRAGQRLSLDEPSSSLKFHDQLKIRSRKNFVLKIFQALKVTCYHKKTHNNVSMLHSQILF